MIKICHFVNQISGKSDGVFKHIISIITNSDKTKYKHLLVFQGGEMVEQKLIGLNIPFYTISSLNKKYSLKTFYDFFRIINNENPEILHTHLIKPYAVVGLLNIFLKKRMIFNYHGLFIKNIYNSRFEKILYSISHFLITFFKSVNLAIAPSSSSKKLLLSETKLFKEIKVYYNSSLLISNSKSNLILCEELKILKSKYFVVGIVARIESQKRIDKALRILQLLIEKKHNVFFIFLGDGPLEHEMKNLSFKLNIEHRCKFYGFVENAVYYMQFIDLLLLTSDWEGFPISIWEAMNNSLPILASDVGGIKEIITTEDCGFVFEKDDLNQATQILSDLLKDSEKLNKLGFNGNNAIRTKYSIGNFAKSMELIYSGVYEN